VGSAEPRAEVRRLLESAVGRLLMEGLSWDEVVDEVRRRLGGGVVEASPAPRRESIAEHLGRLADSPFDGGQPVVSIYGPASEAGRPVPAPITAAPVDEPGEPPVGSVVTDTRTRVCWRDAEGWHRAGTEGVLSWSDVVESVGGPPDDRRAKPGQPTIVSQPERRAQGPMVTRSAGRMELPVQRAVLDDEGKPRLGPNGQPLLKTETETIEISEVVPAGGQR
jgi:hypothetical protein